MHAIAHPPRSGAELGLVWWPGGQTPIDAATLASLPLSRRSGAPEVRWAVRGDGPGLPGVAERQRTDQYHLDSLRPDQALKLRGPRGIPELKIRVDQGRPIAIDPLHGQPERWLKTRLPAAFTPDPNDRWLDVHKRISRTEIGGVRLEISRIDIDGDHWWTAAVQAMNGFTAGVPDDVWPPCVHAHLVAHADELACVSYAQLLCGVVASPDAHLQPA